MKPIKGFTLIELIIVIVLIGILGSIGSLIIRQHFKGYFAANNMSDLVIKANIATDNLMRELKSASSVSALGPTTVTFLNQQGQTIAIDLNGTLLRRNVDGGGPQTLCNQVTSVAFAYFDQAFATTAVASNVRFLTMQMTATNADGLPYSLMTGTVLRKLLP